MKTLNKYDRVELFVAFMVFAGGIVNILTPTPPWALLILLAAAALILFWLVLWKSINREHKEP